MFLPNSEVLCYNVSMNGYDFDKTILKGNSVRKFAGYCFLRLPYLWLLLPEVLLALLLYGVKIIKKEGFLRMLEFFVIFVPCRQKFVKRFWDKNFKCIKQWYLDVKQPTDLVISASPAYLIEEICGRLNVRCITSASSQNGTVVGKHCYGARKVELYRQQFGQTPLETFYSDSMSDEPMFKMAKLGYFVKGDEITLIYRNGEKVSN